MAQILKPLGLAALLAFAGPAIAQDSDASATEETTAVPQIEMGEPADAPEQVEQYVDGVFGDWERSCLSIPNSEAPAPCQVTQLLFEEGNENPIGKISLGKLPPEMQAVAGATVYVPLGVLLTQQLVFRVDSGAAKRYPFTACQPIGCFAQFGFTAEEVAGLKAGAKATISLVPLSAPEQKIDVAVSLKGFTDGWNSLEDPAPATAE